MTATMYSDNAKSCQYAVALQLLVLLKTPVILLGNLKLKSDIVRIFSAERTSSQNTWDFLAHDSIYFIPLYMESPDLENCTLIELMSL